MSLPAMLLDTFLVVRTCAVLMCSLLSYDIVLTLASLLRALLTFRKETI